MHGKEEKPYNDIGNNIKAIRKALGKTIQYMSEITGISRGYIADFERGVKLPTAKYIKYLYENFQVNVNYILSGEGDIFYGGSEEILTDVKKIKTGDKIIDEFLYYFFNSPMAHSYLIYHFRKFLNDENQAIMKDLASSREAV